MPSVSSELLTFFGGLGANVGWFPDSVDKLLHIQIASKLSVAIFQIAFVEYFRWLYPKTHPFFHQETHLKIISSLRASAHANKYTIT